MINLQIPLAKTLLALRARVQSWRAEGLSVGLVPTMGALHEGHLSLVRLAKAHSDRVVTSIFVNPAQFAAGEDLDTYPRALIEDAEKLASVQCDLIYAPDAGIMYPDGYATRVAIDGPAQGLESDHRPHFFQGVATVVTKLFNQVRPDLAVFGEKDYQQLMVIRRLARDLDFGIDIIAGETARERDGLALSSRNAYLSEDERQTAAQLHAILSELAADLSSGAAPDPACQKAVASAEAVFNRVDYISVRQGDNLALVEEGTPPQAMRVLGAVWLGKTRLIDNCAVLPSRAAAG